MDNELTPEAGTPTPEVPAPAAPAEEPLFVPLPTMADLDGLTERLDEVDRVLAALDAEPSA